MILLLLYYQQVRGHSALSAGLLLAPQGVGSALSMVLAGVRTDRIGPRRVVVAGMVVMLAGTAVFTQLGAHTAPWVLLLSLFVRGIGLGASMMPAMAAGYQNLPAHAVSRATTALNIFQRIGGSIATALVTVVLVDQLATHAIGTPSARLAGQASSYGDAFWVVMAITVLGLAAAFFLPNRPPAPTDTNAAPRQTGAPATTR